MMAEGLKIQLEAPVEAVTISGRDVVLDSGKGRFTADAAVIAVPLALLQAGSPGIALPAVAERAVNGLITGNLEKAYLQYEQAWWPDVQVMQVMSTPSQLWAEFYNMQGITGSPVVCGFSGGSHIRDRPADDQECAAQAAEVLRRSYGA